MTLFNFKILQRKTRSIYNRKTTTLSIKSLLIFIVATMFFAVYPKSPAQAGLNDILGDLGRIIILNETQNKEKPKEVKKTNPAATAEPRMDLATRKQVQTALNAGGFKAGGVDGSLGGNSRAAIKRFQSANGYPITGYLTSAQLDDLLSIDTSATDVAEQDQSGGTLLERLGQKETPEESNAPITSDASETSGPESYAANDRNIDLELSRRVLAQHDDLLDQKDNLERWIKEEFSRYEYGVDAYGKRRAKATDVTVAYYNGTTFEKRDARALLKQQIQQAATDAPMKWRFANEIAFDANQFVAGKGVPLFAKQSGGGYTKGGNEIKQYTIFLDHARVYLRHYFDNAPDLSFVPMSEEQAREIAKIRQQAPYNKIQLRGYVSVNGISETVEDFDSWAERMVADATLDRLEIYMSGRKKSAFPNGKLIYTFDMASGTDEVDPDTGMSDAQFSELTGIPMLDGRFVSSRGFRYNQKLSGLTTEQFKSAWILATQFLQLPLTESALDIDQTAVYFAYLLLSETDKRALAKGTKLFSDTSFNAYGLASLTEFERRAVLNKIATSHRESMLSKPPKRPLKVLQVSQGVLKAYDFKSQSFPIEWTDQSGSSYEIEPFDELAGTPEYKGALPQVVRSNFRAPPHHLSVTPETAEQLTKYLEGISGGRRAVYLSLKAELQTPQRDPQDQRSVLFDFQVSQAALYADPNLKELILELPISDGWSTATNPADASSNPVPLLSDDVLYMLFTKRRTDFLGDEARLREALVRRKFAETAHLNEGTELVGASFLPERIIRLRDRAEEVNARVGKDDLIQFETRYIELVTATDLSQVRAEFTIYNPKIVAGSLDLNLSEEFSSGHGDADELEVMEAWKPGALAIFKTAKTVQGNPVFFVVTEESQTFFNLRAEVDGVKPYLDDSYQKIRGDVAFEIVNIAARPLDNNFVIGIEVRPVSLELIGADGKSSHTALREAGKISSKSIAADTSVEQTATDPSANQPNTNDIRDDLKILGVALGGTLDDALLVIEPELDAPHAKVTLTGTGDGYFNGAGFLILDEAGRQTGDFVLAFNDVLNGEEKIGAIIRKSTLIEGLSRDDYAEAIRGVFGEPDTYWNGNYHLQFWWYGSKARAARLRGETGSPDCPGSAQRMVKEIDDGAYLNLAEMNESCGPVLAVLIGPDDMQLILFDSDRGLALRDERLRLQVEEQNKQKTIKKKKIKF